MLRIGLFGAGRIGRVHADSVAHHPRTTLVAVHDPMYDLAGQIARPANARMAPTAEDIIAADDIDAVIIGSSTPTHVELMTAAVKSGKAVLCEKPIDLDLARVDACWQDIKDDDGTIMLGFNRRFDPSFADARARLAAGEIGDLEQLIIISRDPAPASPGYIHSSGGIFRDMTIHDFDMARFFLGDVVEVQAMGANLIEQYIADAGDHDSAMVTLRGSGGQLCQIINSRRCSFGYDQRLEVFGSTGMLSVTNELPTLVRRSDAGATDVAPPAVNFFLERYTPAYRGELDHFVSSIENGAAPSPSFADGREALALADAAVESLASGAAVRLGPAG